MRCSAHEPTQFQETQLLWQIVQLVTGTAPTRIRFPQHTPHKQVIDVAQGRVR